MKLKIFFALGIFAIAFSIAISSCNNKKVSTNIKSDSTSAITFTEEDYDFGTITQGEKVSHSFKFKNTGTSDLLIISAQGSCGCTNPKYSKKPIAPGMESTIDVIFDSDGKSGKVEKTVTLLTNCVPTTNVLTIYANIIAPDEN